MKHAFLILLLAFASLGYSQNIWPDYDFNRLGVKTQAHSGDHAGYVRQPNNVRWQGYCDQSLPVEPFAVYRASAWVKVAPHSKGLVKALYMYGWYSFGWNFMVSVPVKPGNEWTKVSAEFYVPDDKVNFLPLVLEPGNNDEAWIDELEIVKIKSGAEHIAALAQQKNLDEAQSRLLARYYQRTNKLEELRALREKTDTLSKADIDCLCLENGIDPFKQVQQLAAIAAYAACSPDGMKKIKEHFKGRTLQQLIEVMKTAYQLGGDSQNYRRAWDYFCKTPEESLRRNEFTRLFAEQQKFNQTITELHNKKQVSDFVYAKWQANFKKWENKMSTFQTGQRTIVLEGKPLQATTHAIVLPAAPTPSEETAAQELAGFLEEMTNQLLPVVKGTTKAIPLYVGHHENLPGFKVDYAALGLEGIHIESNPKTGALLLAGGQRGVLYAVYDFLEENLGCHWFASDCSVIPNAKETVTLNGLKKIFVPVLEQRDANFTCCHHIQTSVRNKLNGAAVNCGDEWGEHIRYCGFVHTMYALVQPGIYGAEHPEYFAEINGQRVLKDAQLCLTNPEVLKIATTSVREWLAKNPKATIFSVSQNDNQRYCHCKNCMALAEKEGGQMGPLLHFVNAIAADVAKDYPDKIIDTLAYQYTRKPPKYVRPLPNVAIRLCSIECCFTHPLESDPFNRTFVSDIQQWGKICNRLHIWDYVINYRHSVMPFPNFDVLKPNIQFFIKNHVTSIFEEANYYSDAGELAELRSYVMFKLLWDPDYDVDRAVKDFTDAYYGAAAPYIRSYLKMLHEMVCSRKDIHVRIYEDARRYLYMPGLLECSMTLFQEAMNAVKDSPKHLEHVEVAYLPILYTKQSLIGDSFYFNNGTLSPKNALTNEEINFFERVGRKANLKFLSENRTITLDYWLNNCRKNTSKLPVVTLRNKHLVLDILPSCGGRIWRAKLDDRDVFRVVGNDKDGYEPTADGYEEYASAGFRSSGFSEVYQVTKQGADFIELKATLKDGTIVTRRIELLPDSANAFRVTSSYSSAKAQAPRVFRVHPVFHVPSPKEATLTIKQADGKNKSFALKNFSQSEEALDGEMYFNGNDKPEGSWTLHFMTADNKRCTITNTFQPGNVDFCYLHLYCPEKRVNLEQWSKPVALGPNSGPTIANTYTIEVK